MHVLMRHLAALALATLLVWPAGAEPTDARSQFDRGGELFGSGDHAEAVEWYRKAAEQGHVLAQTRLGIIHELGLGVSRDDTEAVKWYRKAAEQGQALHALGRMYLLGRGVPPDYVMAHMWLNLAAASGDSAAAESRDALARRMTAADASEAQRRAGVCLSSRYKDCD